MVMPGSYSYWRILILHTHTMGVCAEGELDPPLFPSTSLQKDPPTPFFNCVNCSKTHDHLRPTIDLKYLSMVMPGLPSGLRTRTLVCVAWAHMVCGSRE